MQHVQLDIKNNLSQLTARTSPGSTRNMTDREVLLQLLGKGSLETTWTTLLDYASLALMLFIKRSCTSTCLWQPLPRPTTEISFQDCASFQIPIPAWGHAPDLLIGTSQSTRSMLQTLSYTYEGDMTQV